MAKKKKINVGKLVHDALVKGEQIDDAREITHEMKKNKSVMDCAVELVEEHKKTNSCDGFVEVLTIKQRGIVGHLMRHKYYMRYSCPTPIYDQTVFHYHADGDHLEFLWVVPSNVLCQQLRVNALTLDKDEKVLLKYVLDFEDNTLYEKAKLLNNEKMSAGIQLATDDEKGPHVGIK